MKLLSTIEAKRFEAEFWDNYNSVLTEQGMTILRSMADNKIPPLVRTQVEFDFGSSPTVPQVFGVFFSSQLVSTLEKIFNEDIVISVKESKQIFDNLKEKRDEIFEGELNDLEKDNVAQIASVVAHALIVKPSVNSLTDILHMLNKPTSSDISYEEFITYLAVGCRTLGLFYYFFSQIVANQSPPSDD